MALDIGFVIFMLYGFYLGFSKGIIETVFTVLSIIFGVMAAIKFAPATQKFLETALNNNSPLMWIAGLLLSFVLMMFIIRLLARGLEGILQTANINIVNQVAGGILLSALSILLYSGLLWFGDQARFIDEQTKRESLTYVYVEQFPTQAWNIGVHLRPIFEDFWNQSLDVFDRLEEMSIERAETEADIYDIDDEEESK